jgi:hypothetical protein
MNCKAPVPGGKGHFFAEVFICETCNTQAVHFWHRSEQELRNLLTITKESIRLSLISGKFVFPEGQQGDLSKREVLEEVLRMEEAREQNARKNNAAG